MIKTIVKHSIVILILLALITSCSSVSNENSFSPSDSVENSLHHGTHLITAEQENKYSQFWAITKKTARR